MEYNCRIKKYATEQQVTIYSKTIVRDKEKEKSEHFTKAYKNDNRTSEQIAECERISINQTKNRIYSLARANVWDWFITMTFDRNKTDSSDYQEVVDKTNDFLGNLRKRYAPDLVYLIVPELHKDGKHYHLHGLLANTGNLNFVFSGHFDRKGQPIFNIAQWRLGFTTATRVCDTARVSGYITKYITKECCSVLKNKKRYYCSNNIKRPQEIYTFMNQDELLDNYADKIKYCKTIHISQAHLGIMYAELGYWD